MNMIRKPLPRFALTLILAAIITPLLYWSGCKRLPENKQGGQDKVAAPAQPEGGCTKVEGSYFGADKAEIARGEVVTLMWKLPTAYHEAAKIEGLTSSSAVGVSYDNTVETPFVLNKVEGMKLEVTTRFVLKSQPQGCQPLELTATVKVKE